MELGRLLAGRGPTVGVIEDKQESSRELVLRLRETNICVTTTKTLMTTAAIPNLLPSAPKKELAITPEMTERCIPVSTGRKSEVESW